MFATSLGNTGECPITPATNSATSGGKDHEDGRNEVSEEEREAEVAADVLRSVGELALDRLVDRWSAFGEELQRSNNNRCSNTLASAYSLHVFWLGCSQYIVIKYCGLLGGTANFAGPVQSICIHVLSVFLLPATFSCNRLGDQSPI